MIDYSEVSLVEINKAFYRPSDVKKLKGFYQGKNIKELQAQAEGAGAGLPARKNHLMRLAEEAKVLRKKRIRRSAYAGGGVGVAGGGGGYVAMRGDE